MSASEDGVVAGGGVPVGDGAATVLVRKVHTRNGERLELVDEAAETRIRIDPLALESLAWQEPDELAALLPAGTAAAPPTAEGVPLFEFTLVNEFSEVAVHGREADGAAFVELVAPRVGHRIRLVPAVLAALAARDTHLFSAFLEEPYGPEGEH